MADAILFDQLHVTFFRPAAFDDGAATAARTALEGMTFLDAVRAAVRRLLDADPVLARLDIDLSW